MAERSRALQSSCGAPHSPSYPRSGAIFSEFSHERVHVARPHIKQSTPRQTRIRPSVNTTTLSRLRAQLDAIRPPNQNLPRFTAVHWFRLATHSNFIVNPRLAIADRQ